MANGFRDTWVGRRCCRWAGWANHLLMTMLPERAQDTYRQMTEQPRESWGPVARRVNHLAYYGATGAFDTTGWPYWADRAIALPEAVCEVLEAYPDASYITDF
jgi:hypothetical protein